MHSNNSHNVDGDVDDERFIHLLTQWSGILFQLFNPSTCCSGSVDEQNQNGVCSHSSVCALPVVIRMRSRRRNANRPAHRAKCKGRINSMIQQNWTTWWLSISSVKNNINIYSGQIEKSHETETFSLVSLLIELKTNANLLFLLNFLSLLSATAMKSCCYFIPFRVRLLSELIRPVGIDVDVE